jgi:hypothetical protein
MNGQIVVFLRNFVAKFYEISRNTVETKFREIRNNIFGEISSTTLVGTVTAYGQEGKAGYSSELITNKQRIPFISIFKILCFKKE